MTDIQYWEENLRNDLEAIQGMFDKIPQLSTNLEKTAALERVKTRLRSALGTKRSYKVEIRLVQDAPTRRKCEGQLQILDQQLQQLQADVKTMEAETSRGELFIQATGEAEASEMDGVKAGDSMLKEAMELQNKTGDSLQHTKQMIAESKEVGISTLAELERQREVITEIDRQTDRLDDNLARAEKLLKQFGKRMASDNFIQCFTVINCLLLLVLVCYMVFKKGGLPSIGDEAPEDPTESRFLRH